MPSKNGRPGQIPLPYIQYTSVNQQIYCNPSEMLDEITTPLQHKTACTHEHRYLTIVSSPKNRMSRISWRTHQAVTSSALPGIALAPGRWYQISIGAPWSGERDAKGRFSRLQNPWTYDFQGRTCPKNGGCVVFFVWVLKRTIVICQYCPATYITGQIVAVEDQHLCRIISIYGHIQLHICVWHWHAYPFTTWNLILQHVQRLRRKLLFME